MIMVYSYTAILYIIIAHYNSNAEVFHNKEFCDPLVLVVTNPNPLLLVLLQNLQYWMYLLILVSHHVLLTQERSSHPHHWNKQFTNHLYPSFYQLAIWNTELDTESLTILKHTALQAKSPGETYSAMLQPGRLLFKSCATSADKKQKKFIISMEPNFCCLISSGIQEKEIYELCGCTSIVKASTSCSIIILTHHAMLNND